MIGGFRVLLFIVILLGIVLISGYTYLMFHHDAESPSLGLRIKSRNFLQDLDSTEKTEIPPETFFNRTSEAINQDVVIFNRVPKTGSEMFQTFGTFLASTLGYHAYIDPQIMKLFPSFNERKMFGRNFVDKLGSNPGIYFRHMAYFDFESEALARPIYASVVRHPVDRMVSWFYYQRWRDRPDDERPTFCEKGPKFQKFCEEFYTIRQRDLNQSDDWYNLTFDDCVKAKKLPECVFQKGSGYLLQKDFLFDFRSQMMFFCGNTVECALFNSEEVLRRAKTIVEEKYSVVGVLEDLDSTFEALQSLIPKFFRNAKELFQDNLNNLTLTHTNKNPIKRPISNQTRAFLEEKFSVEIEFYEFCKQRLHRQVAFLKSSTARNEDLSWPDQVASGDIIPQDDYVLL